MGREPLFIPRNAAGSEGAPVGVIDIGSNSIRLVIFESASYSPIALFNEKVLCAIGRKISSTGVLDQEGLVRAREALTRFRLIAERRGISRLIVVATAAVRDASNGPAFVEEASALCGAPVRVLTGEEEAVLSAQGVMSGIPNADGLVGDLGGGSLELIEVGRGKTGRAVTLPLGPLRLMDLGGEKLSVLRERVEREFAAVPWLSKMAGKPLYAVGGVWRALARMNMEFRNYPLHILQNYEIGGDEALGLARVIAGQSARSLRSIYSIPRKRLETLPYGALVMECLVKATKVSGIVVSAYGLREGLLFELLSEQQRRDEPLIAAARALSHKLGRDAQHGEELAGWVWDLFRNEGHADKRLVKAAALLSDTQWRTHPDYRAEHAFLEIECAQIGGIDHVERAFLALCVFHRYGGAEDPGTDQGRSPIRADDTRVPRRKLSEMTKVQSIRADDLMPRPPIVDATKFHRITGADRALLAQAIGAALRLGYTLSASAPGILPRAPLSRTDRKITLTLPRDLSALSGESVRKRLDELADIMELESQLVIEPV